MPLTIEKSKDLSSCNTLRLSAQAQYFCEVESIDDWREALVWAKASGLAVTILGGGSNVVLAPRILGLVVHPSNSDLSFQHEDSNYVSVKVGAGCDWDRFVRSSIDRGWFGLENLVSIPGSCGAAPVQNIGAYGVDVAAWVKTISCIDMHTGEVFERNADDCDFGYRSSRFKTEDAGRVGIIAVTFKLRRTPKVNLSYAGLCDAMDAAGLEPTPINVLRQVEAIRAQKLPNPSVSPNAGSFFKNPVLSVSELSALQQLLPRVPVYPVEGGSVKVSAAYLIEQAGLKGFSENGFAMSEQHALVLINSGASSGEACLRFANRVAERVCDRFKVVLEREPLALGAFGS